MAFFKSERVVKSVWVAHSGRLRRQYYIRFSVSTPIETVWPSVLQIQFWLKGRIGIWFWSEYTDLKRLFQYAWKSCNHSIVLTSFNNFFIKCEFYRIRGFFSWVGSVSRFFSRAITRTLLVFRFAIIAVNRINWIYKVTIYPILNAMFAVSILFFIFKLRNNFAKQKRNLNFTAIRYILIINIPCCVIFRCFFVVKAERN